MKDFDAELLTEDLTFKIGGEVFQMHYVRPEVLASWGDESIEGDSDSLLKKQDERILSFLQQKDHERYMGLRAREEEAVPMVQINELLNWMVEVQTSRPTPAPSPSASGRGKTARSSSAE